MPKTTAVGAGTTSKLKCAVLAHCAAAGTGKLYTAYANSSVGGGSIFTQTSTGLQLIASPTSGDATCAFVSEEMAEFVIVIKSTIAAATAKPRLVGMCFYFDA